MPDRHTTPPSRRDFNERHWLAPLFTVLGSTGLVLSFFLPLSTEGGMESMCDQIRTLSRYGSFEFMDVLTLTAFLLPLLTGLTHLFAGLRELQRGNLDPKLILLWARIVTWSWFALHCALATVGHHLGRRVMLLNCLSIGVVVVGELVLPAWKGPRVGAAVMRREQALAAALCCLFFGYLFSITESPASGLCTAGLSTVVLVTPTILPTSLSVSRRSDS